MLGFFVIMLLWLLNSSEGDGDRICRCWKVFMLHFQSNGRTKYAWEALRQQFQLASLPPPLSFQLKWGRFVNTRGGYGNNIPCDLFNEHQNKLFKEVVKNMGASMTETAVTRSAHCVSTLDRICQEFDRESNVPVATKSHSTMDDKRDVGIVCSTILKNKVLDIIPGRKYIHFPKFKSNPLPHLNTSRLETWIKRKKRETVAYKIASGEGSLSSDDATDDETDEP